MDAGAATPQEPTWQRVTRTIVVVDVVESVRLMQQHEMDVIERWRRFVHEVRQNILPRHQGRMVKSLGDGMLLEFESVLPANTAAQALHAHIESHNIGVPKEAWLRLRIGAHVAEVVVDDCDIYGAGVNLTARLAALASAGQTVVSEVFRDSLLPGVDADVEDMGNCWMKHVSEPVRAFRTRPVGQSGAPVFAAASPAPTDEIMIPSVAVVPLDGGDEGNGRLLGDMVADSVIAQLSMTQDLRVISRLSTARLRGRHCSLEDIAHLTHAAYALSGRLWVHGAQVSMTVELADVRTGTVEWADHAACSVATLFQEGNAVIDRIAQGAHAAILRSEAQRATHRPLPNLEGYSLLLGGIGLLHRATPVDFQRARDTLTTLTERVPSHASAYAWLAKWHFLRIVRGQSGSAGRDRDEARRRVEQALERDGQSAIAWTVSGLVDGFLDRSLDRADAAYTQALHCNPNEPLAWLFSATLQSWRGDGARAVHAAERALRLSPLDPMRYYFESLAAAAYLSDGQFERAIELCESSLKINRGHTPTYRVRAIAEMLSGRGEAARRTVAVMQALEPELTASRYLARYPGGDTPHARLYAAALSDAGLRG